MTPTRRFIVCLMGISFLALAGFPPAASGAGEDEYRLLAQSYRSDSRRGIERNHHRGRSFSEQRSRLRNPSYLRREDSRRALSQDSAERRPQFSDVPAAPGQNVCRTMTSVETVEGRRALVGQRECVDSSGITHVAPGSRQVIRYYDD
jgi:hypothetical protein